MNQSLRQSLRLSIPPAMAAAALFLTAAPTLAQQARPGELLGMRYLSWAGKPAGTAGDGLRRPGDATSRTQVANVATPTLSAPGRPNRYGSSLSGGNGLTPASAWTGGAPASVPPQPAEQPTAQPYQPTPAPHPMPYPSQATAASQTETTTAPDVDQGRSFRRQDPYYAAPAQAQAAMQPAPQPSFMPPPAPIPTAVEPAASAAPDPMAPRPDALIFRMNQGASSAASPAAPQPTQQMAAAQPASTPPTQPAQAAPVQSGQPPREGARYYSVHREAGHAPDPLILPASVFIGGAAPDLAEPPPAPVVNRTATGQTQAVVQNQDPSLP